MTNKTTKSGIVGKASGTALGKAAKNVKALLNAMKNLAEGTAAKAFDLLKECGIANTLQAAFTGTMPYSTPGAAQVAPSKAPTMARAPAAAPPSLDMGGGGSRPIRKRRDD